MQRAIDEADIRRRMDKWAEAIRSTDGDDVAFAYSLNRIKGTTKDGRSNDAWVRFTAGFRKFDGNWLIVHDHVSLPVDPPSGKGLMNLAP